MAERTLPLAVIRVLSEVDYVPYRGELIREAIRVGASTTTAEVWRAHYLADRDRIIHNQHTVEEIASRREAWRITIPCDLCHDHFEYPDTRTLRVCEPCLNELLRLVAFAASQTTAPAP
ncbi:MAG: hypothetical protein ACRD0K_19440 [Egibacteraceae bacterium]